MKLKVVVADNTSSILSHLVSLLETEFDVVATAENGWLAVECIRRYAPDVVVLGLEMSVLNGIEATRESRKLAPTPAAVICSVETDPEIVEATQQAGALGYVFKMHMDRDLVKAVKSAAHGESFVSPCDALPRAGSTCVRLKLNLGHDLSWAFPAPPFRRRGARTQPTLARRDSSRGDVAVGLLRRTPVDFDRTFEVGAVFDQDLRRRQIPDHRTVLLYLNPSPRAHVSFHMAVNHNVTRIDVGL
jgi:CheY-like chemotaxis protein